ncbi:MAG: hypothetical protein ABEK50_02340, partial [bacterium]
TYVDRNGFRRLVPIVPTGLIMESNDNHFTSADAYPVFRATQDRRLKVKVPEPEYHPLGSGHPITEEGKWKGYRWSDRNLAGTQSLDHSNEVSPLSTQTESGEHGWLVRTKRTSDATKGLRRADSSVADPDPGTYRPDYYSSDSDYYLNDDDKTDTHLYLSESFDTTPAPTSAYSNSACNLKITFLRKDEDRDGVTDDSNPNFLEVFNPGPDTAVLGKIREKFHTPTGYDSGLRGEDTLPVSLDPGEYFLVSQKNEDQYDGAVNKFDVDTVDTYLAYDSSDVDNLGWKVFNSDGNLCDVVGSVQSDPGTLGSSWYDGSPINYSGDIVAFRQKSDSVIESVPKDRGDNSSDFLTSNPDNNDWKEGDDIKWDRSQPFYPADTAVGFLNYEYLGRSFVEVLQFKDPDEQFQEGAEYIELMNTSNDTITVKTDLQIADYRDTAGNYISGGKEYYLKLHPLDPVKQFNLPKQTKLAPGQVALILRNEDDLDSTAIGWRSDGIRPYIEGADLDNDGKGDTIRVFTTDQPEGKFLTDGLMDSEMENIELRGSSSNDLVLSSGSWSQDCALVESGCYKSEVDASNDASHWNNRTRPDGTPGEVPFVEHHGEQWGWGGEMKLSGVTVELDKPICFPSLVNCNPDNLQGGSLGYIEFLRIEDESGKMNIINPPTEAGYDTYSLRLGADVAGSEPDSEARSFLGAHHSYDPSKNIYNIDHSDSELWLSPGGLVAPEDVVYKGEDYQSNSLDEYEHVYTTMRSDTGNRRINLNTAPYESLHGIQINPSSSSDPMYMTEKMVEKIIERRNCKNTFKSGETLADENYDCSDYRPFYTVAGACDYLQSDVTTPINCSTFQNYASVSSGGIFKAVIRAVVTEDGEKQSSSTWEAYVDRRFATDPGKPMRIMFKRKL